jgi:subtilase family serine protease
VQLATRDLSVPASLTGTVLGTMGINQYVERPSLLGDPGIPGSGSTTGASSGSGYPPPPPAFIPAGPCGAYYGAKYTTLKPPYGHGYPKRVPDVVCGYKPPQLRSAYGVKSANMGKGVKVAIVDAYDSKTIVSDSTTYFKKNDPSNPFSKAHLIRTDNMPFTHQSLCGASGWLTEQAIDIQSVHGMAGNAGIRYVGAKSCLSNDLFKADQYAVDNHIASVVSNSFYVPSGDVLDDSADQNANNNLFLLAGATGIGMQFSSGDDGDNFDLTGISAPGFPDSSPYATSVGGTTTKINAKGQRVGDLGWATGRAFKCTANAVNILPGCTKKTLGTWGPALEDGMSGGYTSYRYAQPYYQKGIVPKGLSERNAPIFGPHPMRVTPDISLDADPGTGFLIGLTQQFKSGAHYSQTRYGGTSLASPLLAGLVADIDQTSGQATGFLNPTIYKLDRTRPGAIFDVLSEPTLQANYRRDFASAIVPGVKGYFEQVRELYFPGPEVYCDGTGNCAQRPNTLKAFKGYDSLTGLGAPGRDFIAAVAGK